MQENPQSSVDGNSSADHHQEAQQRRTAIQAIRDHCRAKYQKYGDWKRVKRSISVFTVVGVWLYTGLTYCSLRTARDATIAANRAWVGPVGVRVPRADPNKPPVLQVGQSIPIEVGYMNSGREPGTDFDFEHKTFSSSVPDWNNHKANPTIEDWRSKCLSKTVSGPSHQVIFPGNSAYTGAFNSAQQDSTSIVTDGLLNGTEVFIVLGCMTYRSSGEIRHTSICGYYARGGSLESFGVCGVGNDAD